MTQKEVKKLPLKNGNWWTEEEDGILRKGLREGVPLHEIAFSLQRSINATRDRVGDLGLRGSGPSRPQTKTDFDSILERDVIRIPDTDPLLARLKEVHSK